MPIKPEGKRSHTFLAALTAVALAACQTAPVQPAPTAVAADTLRETDLPALEALVLHEDTRTFDSMAFERLAASASSLLRARTMLAAGRIGDRAALPLLLRGLADPSDSVRTYAAFALGELGDSSSSVVQALGMRARDHGAAAVEAIAALGKIGSALARGFVETAVSRQKGPELQEALLAIWRFPRQPATSTLVRPHTSAPDAEIRWRAVYALTRGGPDPANAPAFRQWLKDADPRVRALAARGLRAATVDSAGQRTVSAEALATALRDPAPHVRINAVNVLATYRDSALAPRAAFLLEDTVVNVRVAAAQALAALKGSAAAGALRAVVSDTSQPVAVRGLALVSLAAVDPEPAVATASAWSRTPDPLLRIYAARAMAAVRAPAALALLRTIASDSNPRVQAQAVAATAAIAADTLRSARTFFIEKLAAASPFVRAEALAGLRQLATPGDEAVALEAFQFALRDSVDEAAIAALGVLARLAENNTAIRRSFATRFPLNRIPLPEVRRAAIRELKLDEICCTIEPRPDVYARVVRDWLAPALRHGPLPRVRINTAPGSFELELLAADAPMTVDNFMSLVRKRFFDGGRWHRVVPNFVLQDGDPTGTGSGGPGYAIRDEINRARYSRGTLGMALSGPDTGGSQWFITHSPQPHLDGGYTVFGRVVSGMEVAERVIQEDPIISIEVVP